jgi:HNH endonuclease
MHSGFQRKTYIVVIFERDASSRLAVERLVVEAQSAEEARSQCTNDPYFTYLDTELVILPKAHNRSNPTRHILADESLLGPRVRAVTAMEQSEYASRCLEVDHAWEVERKKRDDGLGRYVRPQCEATIEDLPPRLRQKICVTKGGCWLWHVGRRIDRGEYSRVRYEGRNWAAHRLIYRLLVGPIPEGAFLLHSCDTPACVNPHHLSVGTPQKNHDDMVVKGRRFRGKKTNGIA